MVSFDHLLTTAYMRHVNYLKFKYKVFTDRFHVKIKCENFLSLYDLISGIYLKTCSKNPTDIKTQEPDVYLKLLQRIFFFLILLVLLAPPVDKSSMSFTAHV